MSVRGVTNESRRRGQTEFPEDVLSMVVDSMKAEAQAGGHFLAAVPTPNKM
jgi:hypothetical protein